MLISQRNLKFYFPVWWHAFRPRVIFTAMYSAVLALCGTVLALCGTISALCGRVSALCGSVSAMCGQSHSALCGRVFSLVWQRFLLLIEPPHIKCTHKQQLAICCWLVFGSLLMRLNSLFSYFQIFSTCTFGIKAAESMIACYLPVLKT